MYSNNVGLSLESRRNATTILLAVSMIVLVAPLGAVSVISEYEAIQSVQVASLASGSVAKLDRSKAGISPAGVMMGVVTLVVAVYALGVFFNATGEAKESGEWAEAGTNNQLLTLVEVVVVLMLAVAAVGIFMSRQNGGRRR